MDWASKRVLITGACGFIGSHLTERLVELGADVHAMVYYNSFNNWGWLEALPKTTLRNVRVHAGDVRSFQSVCSAISNADIVFHLAALIAIPYSYLSPESYVSTNVNGTLNVLQAARDAKVERILVTSTSEVYGSARYVPIDEKHPLQGQSPYSATKIAADKMSEAFYKSFDLPVTIVRPFNTYGPRQSARAIIPTIITQLLEGNETIRLGALSPTRDFNYVSDTAEGFVKIAENGKTIGEEVNIATQREISIGDLAQRLIEALNQDAVIESEEERLRPDKSEVTRLLGSSEKIRRLTDWRPAFTLEEGLSRTIDWFMDPDNRRAYKADIYNL